ncbi:chemotaxis protein [Saccharobesus litoralis]|uniref:Chemotaxis protein n=1 Tax=Saccharobesus litoralis TaxID=2172099 RepID=A0A2S0VSE0_9ALTE|nr:CZB domain-containing protein [Saccharobesus litoralis]AWB67136.1 chemotaxis protein [Saccharobesus litoralis]
MEVVNFRVGNRIVAFNILNILLTEKFDNDQTSVPSEDASFLGIKDFMGVPTPIYDLGIAMNKKSTQNLNQELNDLLHARENDHIEWLNSLEAAIKNDSPFTKATDPHQCEFGKWYDSFKTTNQDLQEVLKKFDEPHKRIHALANDLLSLNKDGDKDQALKILHTERTTTLATLRRLFETAREQVNGSYKPVTVFTTIDGRKPSLGFVIDNVEDSLHVEDDEIRVLNDLEVHVGAIDPRVKKMITGLITTSGKNSLLLEPEAFL